VEKESLKNNPVFNTPGTLLTNNVNNQELKTSNVKQVWGGSDAPSTTSGSGPSQGVTSHYN
jgi:hypothetical protein